MSVYYFKYPEYLTILEPDGMLIFQDRQSINRFSTLELIEMWVHRFQNTYEQEPHPHLYLLGQIAQNFAVRLVGKNIARWKRPRGVEINKTIQREADLWYAIWETLERLNFDGQWRFSSSYCHPLLVLMQLIAEGYLMVASALPGDETNADKLIRRKQNENQQMRGGRRFPLSSNPFIDTGGVTKEFVALAIKVSLRNDGFELTRWKPLLDARGKAIQHFKTTKPLILNAKTGVAIDGRGRHKTMVSHPALTG